jgi:PKD repeat protein
LNVNFTDTSTGDVSSWSWTFGDGGTSTAQNPSHTYNSTGTYSVSLTATGPGGNDTETKTNYITVNEPPPVAGFTGTPTSGVAPLNVNFTDASTGSITSWSWDFGDGGTSTAQNPAHTYTAGGTYSVSLIVTGPGGNDTLVRSNYISVTDPPPVADFTGSPTSGVAPLNVNFSDSSTGVISTWSWTFGDGGTSTAQNPSHTYTSAGTYTVSLTVTGPGGSDTLTRTNYISVSEPPPVAGFTGTPTSGLAPLNVNFSDTSSGAITTWSWTFGDGGTSTVQNPSHTYTAVGTYTVSLTVTGPGGSDTLTRTDYIDAQDATPVANFTGFPTSGTVPLLVSFTDSSTGNITSWSWTFGDGGTSTAQNPNHTYNTAGTYTVALTVSGPGGSDTLTRTDYIDVNVPPPTAEFSGTPTSGEAPLDVDFTDLSTGSVSSWSWDFGDGGTSTAQNPSHTYNSAGNYTVSLTVTGPSGGNTETKVDYITVTSPPAGGLYYITFLTTTTVPGVGSVADDDVVTYDPGTDTWAHYFDGSDVGIGGTDINALHVRADGNLIISFNTSSVSVPGLTGGPSGTTVEDSDLILFSFATSGPNTTGSFSFFFDGSDVGLTTNGEDIDGVYEYADGTLALSTQGGHSVTGLSGNDEDVSLFTVTQLGSTTSGSFSRLFDGSDVGFGGAGARDLNAISIDGADLLFSTVGTYSAAGGSGDDEDLSRFVGSFGTTTSGSASLILDLSSLGIATGEDVDGVTFR